MRKTRINGRKWILMGILSVLTAFVMNACGRFAPKVELTDIVSFYYSESNGYALDSCSYSAELNGDQVDIKISKGFSGEEHEFTETPEFLKKITEIANNYNVGSWDGFDKYDNNVMDGTNFRVSLATQDGKTVNANGYMEFPENYGSAMGEIEALFLEIYEEVFPDPQKVLEKYLTQTLIPQRGQVEWEEISYAYLSDEYNGEKGYYQWQQPDCQDGVHGYIITDLNNDAKEEMTVTFLKNNDGIWQLEFEIYILDEENKVKKAGEGILDENLFANDGLYANVKLIYHTYEEPEYEVTRQIVYTSQKKCFDGKGSLEQTIKVFHWQQDEVSLVANETLISENQEHKNWTEEDYASFVKIADKFGWWRSLQYWKEHPGDLVVEDSGNEIYMILTSSNIEDFADFSRVLTETETGKPAGEYCVSGKLKGYNN